MPGKTNHVRVTTMERLHQGHLHRDRHPCNNGLFIAWSKVEWSKNTTLNITNLSTCLNIFSKPNICQVPASSFGPLYSKIQNPDQSVANYSRYTVRCVFRGREKKLLLCASHLLLWNVFNRDKMKAAEMPSWDLAHILLYKLKKVRKLNNDICLQFYVLFSCEGSLAPCTVYSRAEFSWSAHVFFRYLY